MTLASQPSPSQTARERPRPLGVITSDPRHPFPIRRFLPTTIIHPLLFLNLVVIDIISFILCVLKISFDQFILIFRFDYVNANTSFPPAIAELP